MRKGGRGLFTEDLAPRNSNLTIPKFDISWPDRTESGKPWVPRRRSPVTDALLIAGAVALIPAAFLYFLEFIVLRQIMGATTARTIRPLIDSLPLKPAFLLVVGLAILIAAAVGEYASRRKVPPSCWRVREDLTRCLCDLGYLNRHNVSCWGDTYWVARFGRYNRKLGCRRLLFEIRNVRANQQAITDAIERAPQAFLHAQDVSVEDYYYQGPFRRGRRRCYVLTVWYKNPTSSVRVLREE